jgi:hypothetical protein
MRNFTAAFAAALLLGASSLAIAADSTSPSTTSPNATTGGTAGETTPAAPAATGGAAGQSMKSPAASETPGAASGTSSRMMSESQIKQKLEKDGYTDVTGLKEEKDGKWMGKAMHNGKEVTVDVDQSGTVTAK